MNAKSFMKTFVNVIAAIIILLILSSLFGGYKEVQQSQTYSNYR